ncbi:MAG: M20 family peptidase [Gemmatimonadales bacterium]
MKKTLLALFAGLLILVSVLLVRTAGFHSRQLAADPAPALAFDTAAAAERLAGALRFRTISYQDSSQFDAAEFRRFHDYLRTAFPRAHARLERETVGGSALLFRWTGTDTTLRPIVLMAHQDVVPVEPGTEGNWAQPPFGGRIADGYVWGRGAMDDKGSLVAILEAVERLLDEGTTPRRTIYLAFGHDEEVGGRRGAVRIAELLAARRVEPELVLDEGGALVDSLIPGVSGPVAIIGVAEKGYVTLELIARGAGGHSSMPPPHTAVGTLSAAILRLERSPMPRAIRGPTAALFDYLGPEMPVLPRMVFANRWLFGGLVAARFGATPEGNAMLRTTTAPTMLQAGIKENVLPSTARGVVNFRILPGDSVGAVLRHARRVIRDTLVTVGVLEGTRSEPSPVSGTDNDAFRLLQRTVRQVAPAAIVTPWLVVGGTDARHFTRLTSNVYRFGAIRLGPSDLKRAHGTDERVGLGSYATMVRFYVQLLRNASSSAAPR